MIRRVEQSYDNCIQKLNQQGWFYLAKFAVLLQTKLFVPAMNFSRLVRRSKREQSIFFLCTHPLKKTGIWTLVVSALLKNETRRDHFLLASLKKFVQRVYILSAFSKKNPSPTMRKSNIHGKRGGGGGGGGGAGGGLSAFSYNLTMTFL